MLILFLIGAHFPKRGAHFPKSGAHLPKIGAHLPKMGAHLPKMGAHLPKIDDYFFNLLAISIWHQCKQCLSSGATRRVSPAHCVVRCPCAVISTTTLHAGAPACVRSMPTYITWHWSPFSANLALQANAAVLQSTGRALVPPSCRPLRRRALGHAMPYPARTACSHSDVRTALRLPRAAVPSQTHSRPGIAPPGVRLA